MKGEEVKTVIIGGRIVMKDRRILTLDQSRVITNARSYASKVKKSLEQPPSPRPAP
jgi:hypothetical protein